MKNLFILLVAATLFWSCSSSEKQAESTEHDHSTHAQAENTESKPKSPKQMAMTNVGDNHVHIEYSSPGKRGRQIFGGLVGYGEVWVTGAHRATSISFTSNVTIGGVNIEKGKYGLFTIPGEDQWTVIINTNWDQHLADDYNEAEDVVRVQVESVKLNEVVESLTYKVEEIDSTKGKITISWDDVSISFEVQNQPASLI
jgi:hypothetical protein